MLNYVGNIEDLSGNDRAIAKARTRDAFRLLTGCVRTETGCLEWQGAKLKGYGQMKLFGASVRTHRLAWGLFHGRVPDPGMVVDHLCFNRACIAADTGHLELVTQAENLRRQHARQTSCRRSGHPYDELNTGRTANGGRFCRACKVEDRAERSRARREAKQAAR